MQAAAELRVDIGEHGQDFNDEHDEHSQHHRQQQQRRQQGLAHAALQPRRAVIIGGKAAQAFLEPAGALTDLGHMQQISREAAAMRHRGGKRRALCHFVRQRGEQRGRAFVIVVFRH